MAEQPGPDSFCPNCHSSLNLPSKVLGTRDYSTSFRRQSYKIAGCCRRQKPSQAPSAPCRQGDGSSPSQGSRPAPEWDQGQLRQQLTSLLHWGRFPNDQTATQNQQYHLPRASTVHSGTMTSAVTTPPCSCLKLPLKLPSILEVCTKKL